MATQWIHETSVEVQTTPEDWEEMTVALFVSGSPATPAYFDKSFGNYLPGDDAEIELLSIEVAVTKPCPHCGGTRIGLFGTGPTASLGYCRPCGGRGSSTTFRKAIPADPYAGEHHDQAVLDAVEAWWDDHAGECWDSLDEGGDEADYRWDEMQDRQMESR